MLNDRAYESCEIFDAERLHVVRKTERKRAVIDRDSVVDPWSYLARLGKGTIRLNPVEFRILRFLAASPYRAFSRRRIAQAVSTDKHPVTEETLGRYIRSLRGQLGFFSNYIQRVPFVGYRFKA
jgi:DNA-binding response OmpR family regulator